MLRYLRRPPLFYKRLFLLALPLILQNLITTSLGFVDTFMVGLLGDTQLSAVTAANAPIFLVQVIIFGLMSGLTILVSQFWGKGDMHAINRCMGIAMYAGFTIAACAAAVLFFFPEAVLSMVTDNAVLITEGTPYLRIVGISYIFNAVSSVYVSMQRSAENPLFGMLAAYAIMGNIDKFSTVACFGLAGATAVIIGKRIGEGASKDEVYDLSWCLLLVALGLGILIGGVLAVTLPTLFIPYLYPLFSLSPIATEAAATMCVVYLLTMPLKSFDISNITGVLRAGGDATMASIIDLVPLWFAAVPLAALTALVLDAPMIFVCLGLYAENFFKCPWGIIRLRSRKWINDVTRGLDL